MDARDAQAPTLEPIRLADYRPYPFLVDQVDLTFALHPTRTRVTSKIAFRPNPESDGGLLELDGEGLRLQWARIDGVDCNPELHATGLRLTPPAGAFTFECEVEIAPEGNTALEGLYMSGGMYCTQCEAEGFRKITYYPDRPDVMAPFTVRVESELPVLLSNGNMTGSGEGWAEWHDPWPKPSYLFALVAGDLRAFSDNFTTASGRDVALNIWVRPGDEGLCDYAMDALKRSMIWDEEVYGREYDLDVFNIVAVDDFNMGAMENKGLNIFNSRYVLASPETATDADYERIESIIAHEYFHNWTGNRITCRDWFQLCLKEGLTVFRDQQFSADMRSAPVQRIADVLALRARQFREDAGPLAHNVRPESYIEINNFYTATVYEKGAEIIRMLRTIVGPEAYDAALTLYFDRHDGQACTIEDWLTVFEDSTGRDLQAFKRWYSQAGTPKLSVSCEVAEGKVTLGFAQATPPTPGQAEKSAQVIPIRYALLTDGGAELLPEQMFLLSDESRQIEHDLGALTEAAGVAVPDRVVPSVLRHFSAPVILDQDLSRVDRLVLLAHDSDPFNQWEAGRTLAKDALTEMILEDRPADPAWLDALCAVARNDALDPAFRALALALPSEDDLAETIASAGGTPDPTRIHITRNAARRALAERDSALFAGIYAKMEVSGPFSPDADAAGRRTLRMAALSLLTELDGGMAAQALFAAQPNMTEELAAFMALLRTDHADRAIATFEDRWRTDTLVMDKWFMAQISGAKPENAVAVATALTEHPDFDWTRPNRFRAVIGGLSAGNPAGFHQPDGAGYRFLANWLLKLDAKNPQTAARMSTAFETWARYDADRQGLMQDQLGRIAMTRGISKDLSEMVGRMLS